MMSLARIVKHWTAWSPLTPTIIRPLGHWSCVKSCPVGSREKYWACRRGICFRCQQHGVCFLATSRSRRRRIRPSTAKNQLLLFPTFKQLFSELTSESLTILNSPSKSKLQKVFRDHFWSPPYTFLADTTRRRRGNQHQLQSNSSLTQQPFLCNQATASAAPSPRGTSLLGLASTLRGYIDTHTHGQPRIA